MEKYNTMGVCAREINFIIKEDKLEEIEFLGGCMGNLKGISSLVKGRDITEIINSLEGIECGNKGTSCPDQLSKALKLYKENNKKPI